VLAEGVLPPGVVGLFLPGQPIIRKPLVTQRNNKNSLLEMRGENWCIPTFPKADKAVGIVPITFSNFVLKENRCMGRPPKYD
jgi:hypothetical protein